MNCKELKNLLLEYSEISEITGNSEVSEHIKYCSGCKAAVENEKNLRNAFSSISKQPPPAFLASRIMAIQAESMQEAGAGKKSGLIDKLLELFSIKNFSIAMAAGLAGFFTATIIYKTPLEQTPALHTESPKTVLSRKFAETDEKNIVSQKDSPAKILRMPADELKKSVIQVPPIPEPAEIADRDKIPGAVSFALKAKEQILFEDRSFKADSSDDQIQLASSEAFSSEPSGGAMAPEIIPEMSSQNRTKSSARRELRASIESESFSEEATDPRAEILLSTIEKFEIKIPHGFIKIEELAMRGFIDDGQLKELQPPAGSAWFLEISPAGKKVILKRKQ